MPQGCRHRPTILFGPEMGSSTRLGFPVNMPHPLPPKREGGGLLFDAGFPSIPQPLSPTSGGKGRKKEHIHLP